MQLESGRGRCGVLEKFVSLLSTHDCGWSAETRTFRAKPRSRSRSPRSLSCGPCRVSSGAHETRKLAVSVSEALESALDYRDTPKFERQFMNALMTFVPRAHCERRGHAWWAIRSSGAVVHVSLRIVADPTLMQKLRAAHQVVRSALLDHDASFLKSWWKDEFDTKTFMKRAATLADSALKDRNLCKVCGLLKCLVTCKIWSLHLRRSIGWRTPLPHGR